MGSKWFYEHTHYLTKTVTDQPPPLPLQKMEGKEKKIRFVLLGEIFSESGVLAATRIIGEIKI